MRFELLDRLLGVEQRLRGALVLRFCVLAGALDFYAGLESDRGTKNSVIEKEREAETQSEIGKTEDERRYDRFPRSQGGYMAMAMSVFDL